jgi:ketosteroid isomerase-like protein
MALQMTRTDETAAIRALLDDWAQAARAGDLEGIMAAAHYLLRCGGTGPDGKQQTGWMRVTVCCRRTDGTWKVAHEHFSVPFDMESGKALLGLEP